MIIPLASWLLAAPLSLALLLPPDPPQDRAPVGDPARLVRIDLERVGLPLERILALDLDVALCDPVGGVLEIVAHADDLARIDRLGIPYEVAIEDLVAFYQSRFEPVESAGPYGTWLSPPFAQGDMGGNYTLDELVSVLDQMKAAYPGRISARQSLGQSIEGRDLWMVKISDNPEIDEGEPEVRIDCLHHAREPQGMQTTVWFMLFLLEGYGSDPLATYLVDEREIYFVPCVNPDGYVYNQNTNPAGGGMWRKNRRDSGGGAYGVDLNRNYVEKWGYDNSGSSPDPSSTTYRGTGPASEPEVASMVSFFGSRQFRTALSVHTYSDVWFYPYGYDYLYPANDPEYAEISALATEVNGYEWGPGSYVLYPANGVTIDQDHDAHGTMSWTPEIGGSDVGFWPPTSQIVPLAEENLLAFQRTALAGGAWARVLDLEEVEVGDGDGFFEPGEGVELVVTVRNSGRNPSAATVHADLVVSDPSATVTNAQHDYGALAPFTQASNPASPLALSIGAGTPPGTFIGYEVSVTYEGWTQTVTGSIPIGEPRPFLSDEVEIDLGWTAGVPGDTASRGLWEHGDPIGTDYSGEPCNPEDDATPAPGVLCFITGNGGGSAGTDDVDDGKTTLLTPTFDLSGVGPAVLGYTRWYANLGSPQDDTFYVDISNDDGQNWLPLERVTQNENAWTPVSFVVQDVLAQTATMKLRFIAEDDPNNSLVEAGIDDLTVLIYDTAPRLNLYGRPVQGATVLANISGQPGDPFMLQASLTRPDLTGGATQPWLDLASSRHVVLGMIPASGLAEVPVTVPSGAGTAGMTLYWRARVHTAAGFRWTNFDDFTVE